METTDFNLHKETLVWKITVADEIQTCRQLHMHLLSQSEIEKSNRFRNIADQERYIVTRILVKIILARYNSCLPEDIQLIKNDKGKPILTGGPCFSIAHSGKFIVLACAPEDVGIDVEYINPDFNYRDVLKACFTATEQQKIHNSIKPLTAFYQGWCRKEAILKMEGSGITDNVTAVSIVDRAGLVNFDLDDCHIGALAYNSQYPLQGIQTFTLS